MGKGAGSVSIIGVAYGPTSIFNAGKGGKVKLTTRIQNYFRKLKRNRVKKRITANPHTLEEVVELMKRNTALRRFRSSLIIIWSRSSP